MPVGLVGFDKRELGTAESLVGIDEAGRGCLVGPVVAAAVRCEAGFYTTSWCRRNSRMVDDSKRLTATQRAEVVERFEYARMKCWIRVGIGAASIEEIEKHNIYHANSLAMRRALEHVSDGDAESLWAKPAREGGSMIVLVDGKPIRSFSVTHKAVVKGDQQSLAIALAGIHAKEHRDSVMLDLDKAHPEYGFGQHKGYGTEAHILALRQYGPSPVHRPSFLRKVFADGKGAAAIKQDSLF
jgi:ribonuclease HII